METFVIAELAIPIGIPAKEARSGTETHPVPAKAKISKCSVKFKILQICLCFLLINSLYFIYLMK